MSENRLPDYLEHMLEAAQQACEYTEGLDKDDFLADKRTQQAVILNLVILVRLPPNCSKTTGNSSICIPTYLGEA